MSLVECLGSSADVVAVADEVFVVAVVALVVVEESCCVFGTSSHLAVYMGLDP